MRVIAVVLLGLIFIACSSEATTQSTVTRIEGESVEYAQFCDVALGGEAVTAAEFALDKKLTVECHDALVDPQTDHQVFVGAQMESVQKAPSASTAPPEGAMGRWYDLVCIGGLCRLEIEVPVELGIGQRAVIVFDGFDWGDASTSLSWDLPYKKPTKEIPDSQLCLNLLGDPDVEYAAIKQDKSDKKHLDVSEFGCAIAGTSVDCEKVTKDERPWDEMLVYHAGYVPSVVSEEYGKTCGGGFVASIAITSEIFSVSPGIGNRIEFSVVGTDVDGLELPNVKYRHEIVAADAASGAVEWWHYADWRAEPDTSTHYYAGHGTGPIRIIGSVWTEDAGPTASLDLEVKTWPPLGVDD